MKPMNHHRINPPAIWLMVFMISVALLRIGAAGDFVPLSNFSPLGAMALFGGHYFKRRWQAFLFPLLTVFLSDLVIGGWVFGGRFGLLYSGWYWIYSIFLLIVLLGRTLLRRASAGRLLLATLLATLLHWAVADFSVWLAGGMDLRYGQPLQRNLGGLLQAYAQGLPFERNFLLGTLLYGAFMFGGMALLYRPARVGITGDSDAQKRVA